MVEDEAHAVAPSELESLRDLAEELALEAGGLLVRMRAAAVDVAATKSSLTDVVTQADLAAERLLREELARRRPDDGFYGEEGGRAASSSGLTWVVDPLDGTVNYLYGRPWYAVSIAVVEGDPADPAARRALAGCVHAPAVGLTYSAARGKGARLDGRSIRARDEPDLAMALVGTGFSYSRDVRARQGVVAGRIVPQVRDLRRAGSAALDLCAVASGEADGFFEEGLYPWDEAAGILVIEEAGGAVAHLGTGRERMTVAAGPTLLGPLVAAVRAAD